MKHFRHSPEKLFLTAMFMLLSFGLTGCASSPESGSGTVSFPDGAAATSSSVEPVSTAPQPLTKAGLSADGTAGDFVPAEYSFAVQGRILTWPDDSQAACSLTFDDGTIDQYGIAAPLLDEHGIKGTFFIITGSREAGIWHDKARSRPLFSWEQTVSLLERKHEVGSHSVDHPDLRQMQWDGKPDAAHRELVESAEDIRGRIPAELLPPRGGLTFCWPYWRTTLELRNEVERHYLAARGGEGPPSTPVVRNPFEIPAVMVMSNDSFPAWARKLEMNSQRRGWIVFAFHGMTGKGSMEAAPGWEPVHEVKLEKLLVHLNGKSYWTAPFGDVFRYAVERHSADLLFEEIHPDYIVLRVEDNLPDEIYHIPLSIEVHPPQSYMIDAIETETGQSIDFIQHPDGRIVFDVIPDGRAVLLHRKIAANG